jgi:hypothetical protein
VTDSAVTLSFTDDGAPIIPNVLIDVKALAKEKDVNLPGGGSGHQLREYWVRGPGAAKIRWGTDGSFDRCVRQLAKYVGRPQGLCAEYHKAATGEWPAEKGVESVTRTEVTAAGGMVVPAHTVTAEDGDCPAGHHMMPDGTCMPDEDMPDKKAKTVSYGDESAETAVARSTTAPWRGVLTVEGVESGDGRMFSPNGLTWDEPPLPLMWQKETSHGGDNNVSVRVGTIDKIHREPDPQGRTDVYAIWGEGTLDLNNVDGLEVYRRMTEGNMRGNSVDVDSIRGSDIEMIYPESTTGPIGPVGDDEEVVAVVDVFAQPELTIYKKGRIRASTMVEIPAFTEARLELTDNVLTAATVDERILELSNNPEARVAEAMDAITAATNTIHISDAPPSAWFSEPTDVSPTGALTITAEGRVYGYLAPAGVRHRSFGNKSVLVPLKNVDYGRFMGGETITADGGRVATGAITMGCGHATTDYPLNAAQAKDHYDNTCSLVATVRVGENKNGVWIAGALLPDVTPHQVRRMMACRLSGDWRPHLDRPGWRELTAALLVPVPGFPMARTAPSVQVEEGELVAASIPVQFQEGPSPRDRAAAITRSVRVRQLRSRVSAHSR